MSWQNVEYQIGNFVIIMDADLSHHVHSSFSYINYSLAQISPRVYWVRENN